MGFKPTIIALIFALLAVFAAFQKHRSDQAVGPRIETRLTPLVSQDQLPVDAVTRIRLVRQNEPPMVFQRDGLTWMQIEPFTFPMDAYSMRQLVAVAHQVQIVQRLSPDELDDTFTEQSLGLDPPTAVIDYEWEGGSWHFSMGRRGIAGRAYLRAGDDNDILIVRQDLHERVVEMDPREWRDRTIFRNVSVESERVVRSDGFVLERDRRRWRIREPFETRADGELVEQFLQALGGARSGGFIADQPRDLHRFGLQPSAADIAVTNSRGEVVQRLHIGMPVGAGTQDRYGMVEGRPVVFRVPAAVLQALFRQPQTLVDPTGSGQFAADVRSLRIDGPSGEILLARELDRWRATEHGNVEVPAQYVNDFLSQLTELRAGNVVVQEYPRELEVAVVTLFGFRGQPLDTVRIVHEPGSGAWALENGDNVLRVFERGFAPRLTMQDFGLAPALGN